MTKMILIAGIAALAIAAPAQAGHGGDKHDRGSRGDAQAQRGQSHGGGGGDRRQARAQRDEGQRREQRAHADRPQREQRVRMERPQREQRARMERPNREQRAQMERPRREQRARMERSNREQRAQMERPRREQRSRIERVQNERRARFERPQREQHAKAERMQRERRAQIERPRREQRANFERMQRGQHDQRQRDVREARGNDRNRQDFRRDDRQAERIAKLRQHNDNRFARKDRRDNRFERNDKRDDRFARIENRFDRNDDRFARNDNRDDRRFDRREARGEQRFRMADYRADFRDRPRARPHRSLGEQLNLRERREHRDWYNGYAEQRYRTFYGSSPDYLYDYNNDDGYLYQVRRGDYRVTGLYPVLGGAFGVGRPVPIGYDNYNVPNGYRSLYYDTPDHYYRYGDGAIYRVDRDTQLIQTVAALLTGQNFGVGQRLPLGYDVYNVPYAYRDRYADTSDMWYRYDDGNIYGVDPYSRTIRNVYPMSYGYEVGYPAPAYSYGSSNGYGGYGDDIYEAGYSGYGVPYDYRDLYYAQPGYNYQYSGGGIYRVDPKTQLVQAVVALVTGTTLGVGQALPAGYDVYNVPSAYRSAYFDRDDAWYRYDDGYIYEVDPRTRIVQGAVPVDYQGFAVGYPMPTYAGYAVPDSYDGLYTAEPNYDYRYSNGGIYRVDRDTHVVNGVAALLTGNTFGVGQVLPAGYDVYNVPYAYRSDYQDSTDAWYRYNDGNIYRVDPQTRMIEAVIDAIT